MIAATKTVTALCLECRIPTPADVIIWGKLAERAALGPRCMPHAEERLGAHFSHQVSQWAVLDLRTDPIAAEHCRQCRDELPHGAVLPDAVVVIWKPTLPADALGPKCHTHAIQHIGLDALTAASVPHGVFDLRTPAQRRQVRKTASGRAAVLADLERLVIEHATWDHPLQHGNLNFAGGTVPISELLDFIRNRRSTP